MKSRSAWGSMPAFCSATPSASGVTDGLLPLSMWARLRLRHELHSIRKRSAGIAYGHAPQRREHCTSVTDGLLTHSFNEPYASIRWPPGEPDSLFFRITPLHHPPSSGLEIDDKNTGFVETTEVTENTERLRGRFEVIGQRARTLWKQHRSSSAHGAVRGSSQSFSHGSWRVGV